MTKLVVLNLGKGDLKKGFPSVTAQLWEDGNPIPMQFTGSLPAAPNLIELYRRWQLLYVLLYEALDRDWSWRSQSDMDEDIEINEDDVTNVSSIEFSNLCDDLQKRLNIWLKSKSFLNIEQKLRTKLVPGDEIRLILETEDEKVQRLPWHLWDFCEDYQKAVVCLSTREFDQVRPLHKRSGKQVRILAVLGNSKGIDVQKDQAILEQVPGAQTVFLVEPQRQELDQWLWDKQGWDILFFAGHSFSQADSETGRIYINKADNLTIFQLKNALKAAIARGLRLAIFNSCDGLGLANQLASLHIPQMIFMREPVPDIVAQEFLKHFLEAIADNESFYLAVREAQRKLQGLESDFPCASWLPVISQNPAAAPIIWPKKKSVSFGRPILPNLRILPVILKSSVLTTALVLGIRLLGMLEPSELLAFDTLMRVRPDEGRDQRILIVTVTEADVQFQPAKERGAASLSDRSLAQLVGKLEQFQPRVIGLDIYRENPVGSGYTDLARTMQKSNRLIAICKIAEENKNPGVPPPPEVPKEHLGFNDIVRDPDGILRRQILAMAPLSPCNTDKSFSFQLATRYLAFLGIQPKVTSEGNWQIGGVVLKNLESNSGGYHGIDSLGHQILLNYRSHTVATQVTLKDVLNNKLTPDLVKNRVILIGTSAESFHDYWPTPYSAGQWPHQLTPGVVIQAHMVSQILSAVLEHRPLLSVWSKWYENLWIWCWSLVGGVLAWRFRSLHLGIAGVISICILNGFCLGLLIQGVWVPLIPSALALIACGVTVSVYTAFQYRKQTH